jgi:hypothetical protein
MHLIEPMNEGQKKVLIGLERNLKILEDVIDVMAQIKQPVKNSIHFDANVKRIKEMVKAPKEKKKVEKWKVGFQNFPISKYSGLYSIVKDVVS